MVGERARHDAPVALRARPSDEPHRHEPVEHLRDRRRSEIGGGRELARRELAVAGEAEEELVLREAELAVAVRLAAAEAADRGHRSLERGAELRERLLACGLPALDGGTRHAASGAGTSSVSVASRGRSRAARSARKSTTHGTTA